MKKIFNIFLILFLVVIFRVDVKAYICSLERETSCAGYDYYWVVDISYCEYQGAQTCAKGDSCPFLECNYTNGDCCAEASAWTAYEVKCLKVEEYINKFVYITVFQPSSKLVFSIGDKVNPDSDYVFLGSNCDGTPLNPYKACCDTSTGLPVPYLTADYDGKSPLEAGCDARYYTEIYATTYAEAYEKCRKYNLCQNECLSPPSSGTCSGLNSSTYVYTNGTGLCASGQICCSKSAVIPTPTQPACTMNSQCNDNDDCTSNICQNPATVNAKCVYPLNAFCLRYYCNKTSHTCSATENPYDADAAGTALCQSNLATYYPNQTTGICYSNEADCISACSVPIPTTTPTTTTTQCVPFSCTRRDGVCGGDNGVTFSSTSGKPTRLCKEGTSTEPTVINGSWAWECIGDGSNP